jgi:hypothetical protein
MHFIARTLAEVGFKPFPLGELRLRDGHGYGAGNYLLDRGFGAGGEVLNLLEKEKGYILGVGEDLQGDPLWQREYHRA